MMKKLESKYGINYDEIDTDINIHTRQSSKNKLNQESNLNSQHKSTYSLTGFGSGKQQNPNAICAFSPTALNSSSKLKNLRQVK